MAVNNLDLLAELEERCRAQGIRLVYAELAGEGGLCRLHREYIIIINRRSSNPTRARIIADALARLETETAASPLPAEPRLPAFAQAGARQCRCGPAGPEPAKTS